MRRQYMESSYKDQLRNLYQKYNIENDGLKRNYVLNIGERRIDMDYTTPIELKILVTFDNNDFKNAKQELKAFKQRSWVNLIKELVIYLQSVKPKQIEDLVNFRTDWSKAAIFSKIKAIDNMVKIDEDLYVSVNFTAVHSQWIINDLLTFYGIHEGSLIINRPPKAEPKEVKEFIEEYRKADFNEFLKEHKDEEKANKIVKSIDLFNKILGRMNSSYNNFYLFDNLNLFYTYKSKFLKDVNNYVSWDENKIKTADRYLSYLLAYFKKAEQEEK